MTGAWSAAAYETHHGPRHDITKSAVLLLRDQGLNRQQMAHFFHCSYGTIHRKCKAWEIDVPSDRELRALDKMARPSRFIWTYLGTEVNYLDPKESSIFISDIIHSLCHQNRYLGHTPVPYSVATHCILMTLWARENTDLPNEMLFEVLMHDAHEAYIGDVPGPLKALLPGFRAVEARFRMLVAKKFGLCEQIPPEVQLIDRRILVDELMHFFPNRPYYSVLKPLGLDYAEFKLGTMDTKGGFAGLFEELCPARDIEDGVSKGH